VLWLGFGVTAVVCGLLALRPPNRYKARAAIGLALGALSLWAVVFTFSQPYISPLPSDGRLIHDFEDHRSQFDAAIDAYNLTGSLVRLRELGIEPGVMGEPGPGPIYLPVSSFGMSVSGTEKGYVYSQGLPTPLSDDKDEFSCRHIEGAWYVYHWSW
jgi:hypothetical protein